MTVAQLTKKLHRIEQELWTLRRQITVINFSIPTRRERILHATAGALRHKIKGDTTVWQRRERARNWKGR